MKDEYKKWFIDEIKNIKKITRNKEGRLYTSHSISSEYVPFHNKLKEYIYSINEVTKDTQYTMYNIHVWNKGDFFKEHRDNNFSRKWSYVCELQPSLCNTHLLVEGKQVIEGIFDSNTLHEVPPIQEGTRISLTIFGSSPDSII